MRLTHKVDVVREYVEDIGGEKEIISVEYNHTIDSNLVYVIIVKLCNKLGQLEDLMERYNIKSVDELNNKLKALEIIKKHYHYDKTLGLLLKVFYETKEDYDLLKEVINNEWN